MGEAQQFGYVVPRISVLITAYNRREFLKEAVNSVLTQDYPRNAYEIIVTKNFETVHDEYWKKRSVKLVSFPGRKVGERVADALRYCCGDVICFLDDDDVYAPNKLRTVGSVFKENPELVYMHHLQLEVDVKGRPLGRLAFNVSPKGDILSRGGKLNPIQVLNDFFWWGNHSSICVSRRFALDCLENLRNLEGSIDEFWVVAGMIRGVPMLFSCSPLTYYRIHPSTSNMAVTTPHEYFESLSNYLNRKIRDYDLFLSMAEGTSVENAVRFRRASTMLLLLLSSLDTDSAFDKIMCILGYYRSLFSAKICDFKYFLPAQIRTLAASVLFPEYVKKTLYNYKKHGVS
jgi:glycosyltransferase involved in cell wall biosynthesis